VERIGSIELFKINNRLIRVIFRHFVLRFLTYLNVYMKDYNLHNTTVSPATLVLPFEPAASGARVN
jgi:hypothetical protein